MNKKILRLMNRVSKKIDIPIFFKFEINCYPYFSVSKIPKVVLSLGHSSYYFNIDDENGIIKKLKEWEKFDYKRNSHKFMSAQFIIKETE